MKAYRNLAPLSSLPVGVLYRSLFANAVFSKPWLLRPALSFLSYLCRPGRPLFFDVRRNRALAWLMKQTVYKQFCAGETTAETRATMTFMKELGFRGTIITLATETVFDQRNETLTGAGAEMPLLEASTTCPAIDRWCVRTQEAVDMLGEGDQLAIKMTGAGPRVTEALAAATALPQQMMQALHDICSRCKARQARVLVDAESQLYQFHILRVGLELMKKYNRGGETIIFNTYQAYLKSTPASLAEHMAVALEDNFSLGIKLVRGAYLATEKRNLIHDTKQDTDDAYNAIASGVLRQCLLGFGGENAETRRFPSASLILASHNQDSAFLAHRLHLQRLEQGLKTVPVAFAQLQGMSDALSFGLLRLKGAPDVYKCSTWGDLGECLGYLARRAAENRDAIERTKDDYAVLKAEAWRRLARTFARRT